MLPSEYTGGMACTSHNGILKTHDCTFEREVRTHVIAWYNNAACQFKPLTSGFRLALAYRLVPTTRAPWPSLQKSGEMTKELYRILHTWKADEGEHTPDKVIYLLEDSYFPSEDIRFDKLKDTDLQKVAFLRRVADRLDFGMGLATMKARVAGYREEEEVEESEGSEELEEDLQFEQIELEEVDFKNFVNLDGRRIAEVLPFDRSETIPSTSLAQYFLDNAEPDKTDVVSASFLIQGAC